MAITLYHTDRRPGSTQWGLDSFTEIFKANEAADVVSIDASVPQRGDAHPDYPFMFVTDRYFNESGPSACACDIVYMGCMQDDGEEGPLLPPVKYSQGVAIQSSTSNTKASIFPSYFDIPTTVQFYAPYNAIVFLSTTPTSTENPSDPDEITSLVSWNLGPGDQPGGSNPEIEAFLLSDVFSQGFTNEFASEEIVSGQFYQITKRKIRTLFPYAPAP